VFVLRVGNSLSTDPFPSQGTLPIVYGIKELKRRPQGAIIKGKRKKQYRRPCNRQLRPTV
jgi:hypothetical protein